MVNLGELITMAIRIVFLIIVLYYLYLAMSPSLSEIDGKPSEKRDIPITAARRYYIRQYATRAAHGPTAQLMRKYLKEVYDYTYEAGLFAGNEAMETIFENDERNQALLERLRSSEYQQVLKFNEDCKYMYNQLMLIYDPKVNNTMLNRYLMKHPDIVYKHPDKFRVDYT